MKIIIFDGYCNLCNWFFNFILKRDKKKIFHFKFLENETKPETVIYDDNGSIYIRSEAVLRILGDLPGGFKLFRTFRVIPPFIIDSIYNLIARKRYRWFGKRDECPVITEELKDRFV